MGKQRGMIESGPLPLAMFGTVLEAPNGAIQCVRPLAEAGRGNASIKRKAPGCPLRPVPLRDVLCSFACCCGKGFVRDVKLALCAGTTGGLRIVCRAKNRTGKAI